MRRFLRRSPTTLLAVVAIGALWAFRPVRRDAWIADYLELRERVARSYANLEYAREHGVDLAALDARTRASMESARTEHSARQAVRAFVGAFGDPHFQLVSEPPRFLRFFTGGSDATPRGAMNAREGCAALGYADGFLEGYSLPFAKVAGFTAVGGDTTMFRPALVRRAGRPTVGIVRIRRFSQLASRADCMVAWTRTARDGQCDTSCESGIYWLTGELLATRFARTIAQLERSGAAVVLVDLGGNGGGSEWVVSAAFAAAGHPIPLPGVAVVDTSNGCTWRAASAGRCSNLGAARPDSFPFTAEWTRAPSSRLMILTDRGTASASEYFAATLRDADVARIVGSRTMGAGCGYVGGGGDVVLPRTGLHLQMPNCARFRGDGSNERAGIAPDIDTAGHDAEWVLDAVSSQGVEHRTSATH